MPIALPLSVHPSPAERLAAVIDGICTAIAAHGVRGLLTAPLLLLLWSRLRRMAGRARRLSARIAAGQPLAVPRPRTARTAPARPYIRLSRSFAWLVRAVPATASGASQLQFLLSDPDMAELAQTKPMRRLLRPLCRLLGVQPPVATPPPPPAAAAPQPMPQATAPPLPPEPSAAPPASPPAPVSTAKPAG